MQTKIPKVQYTRPGFCSQTSLEIVHRSLTHLQVPRLLVHPVATAPWKMLSGFQTLNCAARRLARLVAPQDHGVYAASLAARSRPGRRGASPKQTCTHTQVPAQDDGLPCVSPTQMTSAIPAREIRKPKHKTPNKNESTQGTALRCATGLCSVTDTQIQRRALGKGRPGLRCQATQLSGAGADDARPGFAPQLIAGVWVLFLPPIPFVTSVALVIDN